MVRDPRKAYGMKGEKFVGVTVKQNLSHLQLLLCSAVMASLSKECLLHKQHSSRINRSGYPSFSYPYQSHVTVEHTVSKSINNSSVNITNMVYILNVGVLLNKFNLYIN
jgi:hypothetical protein